jgi:hypothetical protein
MGSGPCRYTTWVLLPSFFSCCLIRGGMASPLFLCACWGPIFYGKEPSWKGWSMNHIYVIEVWRLLTLDSRYRYYLRVEIYIFAWLLYIKEFHQCNSVSWVILDVCTWCENRRGVYDLTHVIHQSIYMQNFFLFYL